MRIWAKHARQSIETLLYIADETPESLQSLEKNAPKIGRLAPTSHSIDGRLRLTGSVSPRVVGVAAASEVLLVPIVKNADFDPRIMDKLLASKRHRRRIIRELVDTAGDNGFAGWHFDFEHVAASLRNAYSDFVAEAGEAFRTASLEFSVAVVPRAKGDTCDSSYDQWLEAEWRGGYDFGAIAAACDFISYMTYDQHTARTPPGPIAGFSWVLRCLEELESQGVSPDKVMLGVPFYGRHWHAQHSVSFGTGQRVTALSFRAAQTLLAAFDCEGSFDVQEGYAYAVLERGHVREYVFYENVQSFAAKLKVAKNFGACGIAAWRLGWEDPLIWRLVPDQIRISSPRTGRAAAAATRQESSRLAP